MKRASSIVFLGITSILATPVTEAVAASDWPGFRGPNGDGIVADATGLLLDWPADGLKQVWSVPLHDEGKGTHAGPSVCGERVFLPVRGDKCDIIVCLDAHTGKEHWRYTYSASAESPTYGTGIRAPPTVFRGCVYTLGCYGQLYCLNAQDGKVVWSLDLLRDFAGKAPTFGMSAAPVIMNDMLICEPGGVGTSVVALDPANGKTIWKSGGDEASYATPAKVVLDGVEQILTYMDPGLIGYELKTGVELWRFDYQEQRRKNIPQPAVSGDTIYVTNNTLGYAAVRVTHTGTHGNAAGEWKVKRVWSERAEKLHYSSPVLGDECLFYQNSKHELHCLNLKNGELAWTAPDVGEQYGAVLRLGSNNLLTALENGELRVFEVSLTSYRERSRFKAVDSAFVQPALAGECLFVRDHERVVCYELRASAYAAQPAMAAASKSPAPGNAGSMPKSRAETPFFRWDKIYNQFFTIVFSAVVLTIAGSWALLRRQLPQATVICGSGVLGSLLTMLVGAHVTLHSGGFWSATRFFRLAPVIMAFAVGLLLNFGCKALPECSGWKLKRVWIAATAVCLAILAHAGVQSSAVDLESILLSTVPHDAGSDYSLLKFAALASALVALFFQRSLTRNLGNNVVGWFTQIIILRLGAPVIIGFAVYAMGGIFSLVFLVAPVLFAAQFRRGPLASLLIANLAAVLTSGGCRLLVQNTKYTFALPAVGAITVLCLAAVAVRKLLEAKSAEPAVSVAALPPQTAAD
jgi:outer membrane protein assembly factor BamB